MAVFIDIYGNEARVLIQASQFGRIATNSDAEPANHRLKNLATKKAMGN